MLLDAVVKNQRNITGLSPVVINRATSSTATISNHLMPNSKKKKVDLEENDFNSCLLELAEYEGNLEQNSKTNPDQVSLVKAAQEVDFFFNHSIIEKKEDVFNYWKHEEKFPLLKELALKLLAPPASSVFSERLFSEYGNIFEKKRSRLLPQCGEMLLFIHHNGNKFINE
nr:uncharacterized protein LOC124811111 [Hydra vulgaris]